MAKQQDLALKTIDGHLATINMIRHQRLILTRALKEIRDQKSFRDPAEIATEALEKSRAIQEKNPLDYGT